jgi:hypothetical protein
MYPEPEIIDLNSENSITIIEFPQVLIIGESGKIEIDKELSV